MADTTILARVKTALNITGDFQDATLQLYINEVVAFLTDAGAPETFLSSDAATGIICRGVSDLWQYGAGQGKLSPYFYQRAIQAITQATGE